MVNTLLKFNHFLEKLTRNALRRQPTTRADAERILGITRQTDIMLLLARAKVSGRISEIEQAEQDQELLQTLLSQENS